MRVKLEGRSDIERIVEALQNVHSRLPEGTTWHSVNFYITLRDENGSTIELLDPDGLPLGGLVFSDPNKVKRQLKERQI